MHTTIANSPRWSLRRRLSRATATTVLALTGLVAGVGAPAAKADVPPGSVVKVSSSVTGPGVVSPVFKGKAPSFTRGTPITFHAKMANLTADYVETQYNLLATWAGDPAQCHTPKIIVEAQGGGETILPSQFGHTTLDFGYYNTTTSFCAGKYAYTLVVAYDSTAGYLPLTFTGLFNLV